MRPLIALVPATLLLALAAAVAQTPAPERVFFQRSDEFRIPFHLDGSVASVKLYVSEDFGQSWQLRASAGPNERAFPFRAPRDGWYWFAVQTIDGQGKATPTVVDEQTKASLKICVDRRKPVVALKQAAATDGGVAVTWSVQDENLKRLKENKADALILEYRPANRSVDWVRVPIEQRALGDKTWAPEWAGPLDVRLRALDDAGNEGEDVLTINGGGGGGGGARSVTPGYSGDAPRPADGRKYVNTKKVNLKYDVKELGKSGISEVQLWFTDGRSWEKKGEKTDPKEPYVYEIDLANEGLYGFTLLAKSGVGLAEQEPRVGDAPQVWIEADWTKPAVVLQGVEVGRGSDTGVLSLTYTADDKNLDPRGSITFAYAAEASGPWTTFGDKQDNTGRHRWTMPPTVPFSFFVRVSATDRAGNVGSDQTKEVVKVDLSRPKARVMTVEPAKE